MPQPSWQVPSFVAADIPKRDTGLTRRKAGFLPGGTIKSKIANFSGGAAVGTQGFSLYGVDGVNPAWVFDGVSVQFIETGRITSGMSDNPVALAILPTQQLALGYTEGSLTLSSVGEPTVFDVSSGAAEIAVSDAIVELAVQPSDVLAIFCRSSLKMLTGKTSADFELSTYSEKLGITAHSLQPLGDSIFLTDDGITRLNRVQQFGDFRDMSLSEKVKPLLDKLKRKVMSSWVVATRNEYWLLYENGTGVTVKFIGADVAGITTFNYGEKFTAVVSAERNGVEVIYAGAENGFVYQLECGPSFDGVKIPAYFNSVYEFMGSVEHRKRFKKIQVEVDTEETCELLIRAELDYATPEAPVGNATAEEILGGGGFYDLSLFENILWSDAQMGLTDTYIQGVGRNISVATYSLSDCEPPHTIGSLVIHWAQRGRRA